jgi:hypothetical protein
MPQSTKAAKGPSDNPEVSAVERCHLNAGLWRSAVLELLRTDFASGALTTRRWRMQAMLAKHEHWWSVTIQLIDLRKQAFHG